MNTELDRLRWRLAGLGAVVVYFGIVTAMYLRPAYDPFKFVCFAADSPIARIAPLPIPEGWGPGYDGQAYYVMALDPFDIETIGQYVGGPAYRYQRILMPLLAWLVSFGYGPIVHLALIGLGFALTLAGTWALMQWCRLRQVGWGWALLFPLLPGTMHSLLRITPDAPAAALAVCGAYLAVREKPARAALLFALAVLTKETFALVPLGLLIAAAWNRDSRRVLWMASPIVVLAVWSLVVRGLFGELPAGSAQVNLGAPLAGIHAGLARNLALLASPNPRWVKVGWFGVLMISTLFLLAAQTVVDVLRSRTSGQTFVLVLILALSLVLSGNVWRYEWAISRMVMPVSLFLLAHGLETEFGWSHKLLLALNVPLLVLTGNWMNLHF